MKSSATRERFLAYFAKHNHARVPSSPLVPGDDPTLLFTNAGMVQFKDVFLGFDKRDYDKAVTSQRCLRAGGKHNDLENVGYTARHHTFFEMLGNFSFGDYFKERAIPLAWDLLTTPQAEGGYGLAPANLWVTVFGGGKIFGPESAAVPADDEAKRIWIATLKDAGFSASEAAVRVTDVPTTDNFWMMGDTGPCGPCSEIFYNRNTDARQFEGDDPAKADLCVEIWNLVFMQFNRNAQGQLSDLPKPCVDTGMGLERLCAVLQNKHSNYETDLFTSLIDSTRQAIAVAGGQAPDASASLLVIADHIRAAAFLVADKVLPSNEGRGYVLRRIIRRALRHGHQLKARKPFFASLAAPLARLMGDAHPELPAKLAKVTATLATEEEKFAHTLNDGMKILIEVAGNINSNDLPKFIDKLNTELGTEVSINVSGDDEVLTNFHIKVPSNYTANRDTKNLIDGPKAFKLYDTYGFPIDLTANYADEQNLGFYLDSFKRELAVQQERSRAASGFKVDIQAIDYTGPTTSFDRDVTDSCSGEIIGLYDEQGQPVQTLAEGTTGLVILSSTNFYAEAGGQLGDRGYLEGTDGQTAEVKDTIKVRNDVHGHQSTVTAGELVLGEQVSATIDSSLRRRLCRAHSATHLLHEALRFWLGNHVEQRGSLVDQDRLRFDYAHDHQLKPIDLYIIERIIYGQVLANATVTTEQLPYAEAIKSGAKALFDEKYGSVVRVVTIDPDFSVELCGGTHVSSASEVGYVHILSDKAVAAGVRRIEALTGLPAQHASRIDANTTTELSELLKQPRTAIVAQVVNLQERLRAEQKRSAALQSAALQGEVSKLTSQAIEHDGVRVLVAQINSHDMKAIKEQAKSLTGTLKPAAVMLFGNGGDKVGVVASISKELQGRVSAKDWIASCASTLGARGGGNAELAQAGGGKPDQVDQAIGAARKSILALLTNANQ